MKAYVFPGQGAQFSGMGKDLYDQFDWAKELFAEADSILGFKISDIMFSGSDEEGGAELSAEQAALKKAILTHIDESDQEYLDMIGKKH